MPAHEKVGQERYRERNQYDRTGQAGRNHDVLVLSPRSTRVMGDAADCTKLNRVAHCSVLSWCLKPLGQKVNCSEELTFDCRVDAITGNVHASYWTFAERLKLDRTQKSARTLASA